MLQFGDLGLVGSVGTVWLVVDWIIRLVALLVVPRNRKPTAGMAWLLFIFLLPVLGMLLFIILGSPKLPKSRRDAQVTIDAAIKQYLKKLRKQADNNLISAKVPEKHSQLAKLSESLSSLPVFGGNKVELLPEYDEVIVSIVDDIDKANYYVHIEYFIIALDQTTLPIFDAIKRAVDRGVIVRVMYDSLSTKRYPKWKEMLQLLQDIGAQTQPMLPLRFPGRGYVRPDLRNHRKLIVIDGETGYTGSQNLVTRNYHRKDDIYYDELVVRLRGPIVLQLSAVFSSDWFSETGVVLDLSQFNKETGGLKSYGTSLAQILPSGPGYEDENNLKLFTSLIHSANERVIITNPYIVPDDALTKAITTATRRGVEIIMINSEVMDQWMVGHAQRSFYETLLEAGVKIHLYHKPILLHSKFITVDDSVATVGSSNLDIRSFLLDLEVTLISYDPAVVKQLNKVAEIYLSRSSEITLEEWRGRSKIQGLMDNIARLTSAVQ